MTAVCDIGDVLSIEALRPTRDPDMLIGPPDDPYMLRWWLIPRNPEFNVYYHRILHDDDDRARFAKSCRGVSARSVRVVASIVVRIWRIGLSSLMASLLRHCSLPA